MKYLDEEIIISIDFSTNSTQGIYDYYIYMELPYVQQEEEQIIFVGKYFNDGFRVQNFNITDIVRSNKTTWARNFLTNSTNYYSIDPWIIEKYKIRAYRESTYIDSPWVDVSHIWRYPNVIKLYTTGDSVFNFDSSVQTNWLKPALQSTYLNKVLLIPHYPLVNTKVFKYVQTFVHSNRIREFYIEYKNEIVLDDIEIEVSHDPLSTSIAINISDFLNWDYYEQDYYTGSDVLLNLFIDSTKTPIAIFDRCYKRYYLQWEDRYGGMQSQAFNDNSKFSEDFQVTETNDYTNNRNKSFISIQPKWELTSGWIKEDLYPYYESLFISNNVILYDAQEDVSYEVLVTGKWVEKKYKNEKKLLNITLNLEQTKKQNIVY